MTLPSELLRLVEQQSAQRPGLAVRRLSDELVEHYGDAVQAILFYGSCLRSGDELDGLVDLYVIVDSYRAAYGKRTAAFFNKLLPPNVFYLELPFENQVVRTKYAVVSMRDLQRGTSTNCFNSSLWGRFAQPTGLVYARTDAIARQVNEALAQAVITFITRTLPQLPECFDAATLWRTGLGLSYRAELRVEKQDRVDSLVAIYRDNYEQLTQAAVSAVPFTVSVDTNGRNPSFAPGAKALPRHLVLAAPPPVTEINSQPIRYRASISPGTCRTNRLGWALRRTQGKLLSLARLVKGLFTFKGGLDYLAWKLERHTGVKVDVTPKLRRYPLLYVWGVMWRLYRQGAFR